MIKAVATTKAQDRIVTMRVDLVGLKPPIWRRLEVPADYTLEDLHYVLQLAMGWEDAHLHAFLVNRTAYSIPADEEDFGAIGEDSGAVTLESLALYRKGAKFHYEYDFGDSWEHQIVVESASAREPGVRYPRCLKAVGACPPEDCGGVPGYTNLLEALKDPRHEDHDDMVEWLGGEFDPAGVDLDAINAGLAEGFRD